MEQYANLIIAFISTNGAAIAALIINLIVNAVKQKALLKKTPSYANIELQLMRINSRLDKMESKKEE